MALFLVVVVVIKGEDGCKLPPQCALIVITQSPSIYKQCNMTLLGRLSMSSFIHAGAVEMTVVVLLCYGIAVKEGHVKAWLPAISSCGKLPPEVRNNSTVVLAIALI